MSEFLCLFCSEYSPKLLRTHTAVAWLHPSLPSAVFLPPCGVSFFSTTLSWSSRKAAAWPAQPLWVPEEPFHTSFQAQPEQRSSCCLGRGRCYTHGLEFTVSCHLQSHPAASLETISATGFALYFPLLLTFKVLYCAFPYFASFIVFNLLGPFLILLLLCTLHDKVQSVFWSGYYTQ